MITPRPDQWLLPLTLPYGPAPFLLFHWRPWLGGWGGAAAPLCVLKAGPVWARLRILDLTCVLIGWCLAWWGRYAYSLVGGRTPSSDGRTGGHQGTSAPPTAGACGDGTNGRNGFEACPLFKCKARGARAHAQRTRVTVRGACKTRAADSRTLRSTQPKKADHWSATEHDPSNVNIYSSDV